jgi:hypothetical protein
MLRYDQSYSEINGGNPGPNKPRNNLRWSPGGSGGRLADDVEYWMSSTWYIPADYEIDKSPDNNQEILLQMHNGGGGAGHASVVLGGDNREQEKFNIHLHTSATTDQSSSSSNRILEANCDIEDLKGQFVTMIWNFRFNPFSKNTTVTSGMGRYPQIGESFAGNKGKFNVWMSVPAGVTVDSNTLGSVTNNTSATKMMKVCTKNNTPCGLVPGWRRGIKGENATFPGFNLYKGRWMDQIPFANRPSIPHAHSTKPGPIKVYLGYCWMGDASSDYQSVHPAQEVEPD